MRRFSFNFLLRLAHLSHPTIFNMRYTYSPDTDALDILLDPGAESIGAVEIGPGLSTRSPNPWSALPGAETAP